MSVHFSESEGRLVAERVEPADEAACLPGPADPSDEVVAFEFAVAEVNGEYAPRRCRPRVADARLVLLPDAADGDGCVARNGGGALATGHRGESARVLHRAANYSHRICRESIFQRTRGCAEISWTMRSGGDAGENAHMRADLGESVTVALAWNRGPLFVQPGPPMACRHPPLVAPPGGWQETQRCSLPRGGRIALDLYLRRGQLKPPASYCRSLRPEHGGDCPLPLPKGNRMGDDTGPSLGPRLARLSCAGHPKMRYPESAKGSRVIH